MRIICYRSRNVCVAAHWHAHVRERQSDRIQTKWHSVLHWVDLTVSIVRNGGWFPTKYSQFMENMFECGKATWVFAAWYSHNAMFGWFFWKGAIDNEHWILCKHSGTFCTIVSVQRVRDELFGLSGATTEQINSPLLHKFLLASARPKLWNQLYSTLVKSET